MSELITAEYGKPDAPLYRRVVIDQERETITFFRCLLPNRFLSLGPLTEHTCSLDDVRGFCWSSVRGVDPVLEVVTSAGRARLPNSMAGFEPVRAVIEEAAARSADRLRWYEYPAAHFLLLMAVAPLGVAVGLGIWVSGVVPEWAFAAGLGAAMFGLLVPAVLTRLRGRALW